MEAVRPDVLASWLPTLFQPTQALCMHTFSPKLRYEYLCQIRMRPITDLVEARPFYLFSPPHRVDYHPRADCPILETTCAVFHPKALHNHGRLGFGCRGCTEYARRQDECRHQREGRHTRR